MQKQEKILIYAFALFSLITSFLFVFYAVNVNLSPAASRWLKTFAYVVGGYGLFNIYILSWAWRSYSSWAPTANLVIAACFFGVFALDTLKDGIGNRTVEGGSLLALAAVLLINWYTIKKLTLRERSRH